jgi:hypothetical protein
MGGFSQRNRKTKMEKKEKEKKRKRKRDTVVRMTALKGLLTHCRGMTLGGPCSGLVAGQRFAVNAWRLAGESNGAFSAAAFHTTAPCQKLRMRGTVVSDGAQKTVVVAVERIYKHPVVKKYVKTRNKFMAHDELDQFKVKCSI